MSTYLERMEKEFDELSERHDKCYAFNRSTGFENLDSYDQHLLQLQEKHMWNYLDVLGARIRYAREKK
jgi:tRNA 2-selenouridine synthase SelU